MKHGTLLPNAGVDASNAPEGCVVPLPENPSASAASLRSEIAGRTGTDVAVIIADSRPHAMRAGCAGITIGCAGVAAVTGRLALADCLASAAELVMGEADEGIPASVIRGLAIPLTDTAGVSTIDVESCIIMGPLRRAVGDDRE